MNEQRTKKGMSVVEDFHKYRHDIIWDSKSWKNCNAIKSVQRQVMSYLGVQELKFKEKYKTEINSQGFQWIFNMFFYW